MRRSLKFTTGCEKPPSAPSEAHQAIANTATAAAASFVLRWMGFLILLSPLSFREGSSPGEAPFLRPANLSPGFHCSVRRARCHPLVTAAWTLLPSDQTTIGGVWRLPSRIH